MKNLSEDLLLAQTESWVLPSEAISVANSVCSMTGYPAQGATWPPMWPVEVDLLSKRRGGRDGNTDMDSGGIPEANGHPNLCPFQLFRFLNPHLLVKSHLVGY